MDDNDLYLLKRRMLAARAGLATIQSLAVTHQTGTVGIGTEVVVLTVGQKTAIKARMTVLETVTEAHFVGLDAITGKTGVADPDTLAAGAPRLLNNLVSTLTSGLQSLDTAIPPDGAALAVPDKVAQNLADLAEAVSQAVDVAIAIEQQKVK
jgi:hypothetical protein